MTAPRKPRAPRRRPVTAADAMPERGPDGLEQQVRGIVKDLNPPRGQGPRRVLAYHTWRSDHSEAGFPDWFFVGVNHATGFGEALAMELKRQSEDPSDEQAEWLAGLSAAGIRAVVRRPSDLLAGDISRELTALAGLPVRVPAGDVAQLTALILRAVGNTVTAGLAENIARAVLRGGYTPRGAP